MAPFLTVGNQRFVKHPNWVKKITRRWGPVVVAALAVRGRKEVRKGATRAAPPIPFSNRLRFMASPSSRG